MTVVDATEVFILIIPNSHHSSHQSPHSSFLTHSSGASHVHHLLLAVSWEGTLSIAQINSNKSSVLLCVLTLHRICFTAWRGKIIYLK